MKNYYFYVVVTTATLCASAASEPISLLIGSALVAGGWYKWDTIKENTVCKVIECCNNAHVPYDMDSEYM